MATIVLQGGTKGVVILLYQQHKGVAATIYELHQVSSHNRL